MEGGIIIEVCVCEHYKTERGRGREREGGGERLTEDGDKKKDKLLSLTQEEPQGILRWLHM